MGLHMDDIRSSARHELSIQQIHIAVQGLLHIFKGYIGMNLRIAEDCPLLPPDGALSFPQPASILRVKTEANSIDITFFFILRPPFLM